VAENTLPESTLSESILPASIPDDAEPLPCPPRALWHDLPPSLGSGIPARIRSARPIPPRSPVTDFLPLHRPVFHIGKAELLLAKWSAPDREHTFLESAAPAPVQLETEFPSFAEPVRSTPRIPGGAELGSFSAPDQRVPVVQQGEFSNSTQPVLPVFGSQPHLAVPEAPAQLAWQLSNTFFTPRRRIAQPEPEMRPLPAPQSGSRPLAGVRVRPTQMAGIIERRPWQVADLPKPVIPNCINVVQEPTHQLSHPRPAISLRPRSVFQDTVPGWLSVPNSYVRRIEIEFRTETAGSVALSSPLPALAR